MSIQSEQKRPISPKELFERLLVGNWKELQCVDEAAHAKQQRQILISLISEYRQEIAKRLEEFDKLEKLVHIRNALRLELERLREDRISIDRNIVFEIEKVKLTPIEIKEQAQRRTQIQQMRLKIIGLEARLRQLTEYALKIERHNSMLQKQNRIIRQTDFCIRTNTDVSYGCYDGQKWRQKIRSMRLHQQNLSRDIMNRIKERQEQSLLQAKLQEQQIAERNRRRLASFQQRFSRV